MRKHCLLLLALPLLAGCQPLLRWSLGIRNVEPLTDRQVQRYAQQQRWQGLPLLRVDSLAFRQLGQEVYKPGWPVGFRPLQFLCYDRQGRLVAQYASCESLLHDNMLRDLPPSGLQLPDTTRRLAHLLHLCHLVPGSQPLASSPGQYDYTIAVYWTSWLGRQSAQLVARMQHYAANHPTQKIQLVLVNADYYQGKLFDEAAARQ